MADLEDVQARPWSYYLSLATADLSNGCLGLRVQLLIWRVDCLCPDPTVEGVPVACRIESKQLILPDPVLALDGLRNAETARILD